MSIGSLDQSSPCLSIGILRLAAVLFLAAIGSFSQTQEASSPSRKLPPEAQVRSADWHARREAFAKLIGVDPESYTRGGIAQVAPVVGDTLKRDPATADARRVALIQLLETENALVQTEPRLSEEYLSYYGDLIAAVSSLRDRRSLSALLGAITTGEMVTAALVSLGKPAVGPVGEKLKSPDPVVRSSAAAILSQMLQRSAEIANDPVSRSKIRAALFQAAADSNPWVRKNSVEGLVRLGDRESIGLVERMAKTDPYEATFMRKKGVYPVREAAKKALDALIKRNPNTQ